MDQSQLNSDERYVYEERLALLGVVGRDATADESNDLLAD